MNELLQKFNETVITSQTRFTITSQTRRGSFTVFGGGCRPLSSSTSSSGSGPPPLPLSSSTSSSPSPTIIYPCSVRQIPFTVPTSWMFTGSSSSSLAAEVDIGGCRSRLRTSKNENEAAGRAELVRSISSNEGQRKRFHSPMTSSTSSSAGGCGVAGFGHRDFLTTVDFRGCSRSLGTLDPRLYKLSTNDADDDYEIPDNHIGRLWFSVKYDSQTEKLLVTVVKARNLASRIVTGLTGGASGSTSDHFVRLYLLPDERRYLQTKFKKKTSNPQFDEQFVFQVSSKDVISRVIKLTVYEVDRLKRHVVLGHALCPLREYWCTNTVTSLDDKNAMEIVSIRTNLIWKDLQRELTEATTGCENGELLISLCYKPHLERLAVGVIEGKHFKLSEASDSHPDLYAKVCLQQQSKAVKTKKTGVVRRASKW